MNEKADAPFIHHSSFRIHHSNLNAPRTVTRAARPATDAPRLLPRRAGLFAVSPVVASPAVYRAALAFDAALSLCTGRAALEARDLGGREVSPLADGQALSSDRADPHAAELQDGVADRVE